MPVESVVLGFDFGRDGGHHKIAAVAAVAGDGKSPAAGGSLRDCGCGKKCLRSHGRQQEQNREKTQRQHADSITRPASKRDQFIANAEWERSPVGEHALRNGAACQGSVLMGEAAVAGAGAGKVGDPAGGDAVGASAAGASATGVCPAAALSAG